MQVVFLTRLATKKIYVLREQLIIFFFVRDFYKNVVNIRIYLFNYLFIYLFIYLFNYKKSFLSTIRHTYYTKHFDSHTRSASLECPHLYASTHGGK